MTTIPGRLAVVSALFFVLGFLPGCGDGGNGAASRRAASSHTHVHTPPHGGTPVMLGEGDYHLELVLDAAAGTMKAYVLDGHLDQFVRISQTAFGIKVKRDGTEEKLQFQAVASSATGEAVGNTALFEARADWLKQATEFEAAVEEITIQGKRYENVPFSFPKGTAFQH